MTKAKLIQTIKELPEKLSVDHLFDKTILLHKINFGLEQSRIVKSHSENRRKRN